MRKAIGIFLFIIGSLLTVINVIVFIQSIPRIFYRDMNANAIGYVIGSLLASGVMFILSIWLVRIGLKLQNKKAAPVD